MSDTNSKIKEIEKKIKLVKLMIEKRGQRVAYYQKLIKMGLAADDRMKLDYYASFKSKEIRDLTKELDKLYVQKSLYELEEE